MLHDGDGGRACGFYDCGDLLDISGQHHNLRHDVKHRAVLFLDDDVLFFV